MNTILDNLEEKWRRKLPNPQPSNTTGEVQFFAWDENKAGDGIVVCIGSNFGQKQTMAHIPTKANLRPWFNNYQHAAEQFISPQWQKQWREHGWLVGTNPPLKPRFFIMTNLVPWITNTAWGDLPHNTAESLMKQAEIQFNGGFLDDLQNEFPDAFAVGHGINENILPFLFQYRPFERWRNWMLYANLSHKKTPTRWTDGRFVF